MYYPYLKQESFFSQKEHEFYLQIKKIADSRDLVVFSKVRLADLVWVPKTYKAFKFFFNKIKAKQIDFVLCDSKSFEIVCLIELDDISHELSHRQSRDRFVNKVIKKSGHNFIRCSAPEHVCTII